MAAREVIRRRAGFSLLEVLVTVAIAAVLVALAANALTESRRVSRVNGQARLLVQRLQTVRTNAVSQGTAQGYAIGPNGSRWAGQTSTSASCSSSRTRWPRQSPTTR